MPLQSGTKLGQYEILAKIGAGGMGEVYRARDTKLGREVAIKVLPEAFAQNEERLARFEREAKLLASLNHPGIATVHGFETSGEVRFLVMELVEGETLAERIERGALSPEDALAIARQMAEGLEAAHEKGIVHRDLKPANVKVTEEGGVKILDFGLAKALEDERPETAESNSPTLTRAATQAGVLLGTAAYMSPEQARGQKVDRRTDIWAFGVVLFEMLTGTRMFSGETVSDVLARVLTAEPDWSTLPATTPPSIRKLLRRCLERKSTERLRDIGDARLEIKEAFSERDGEIRPQAAARTPWLAVALAAMLGASLALIWQRSAEPERAERIVRRSTLPLSPEIYATGAISRDAGMALSLDGKLVVYVGGGETSQQLYLRPLDSLDATPVPGTEGASFPFLSPDAQWVGFRVGHELKKASLVENQPVVTLVANTEGKVATWSASDVIYYTSGADREIHAVAAAGGQPELVTRYEDVESAILYYVRALPGDRGLLASFARGRRNDWVALYRAETKTWETLLDHGGHPNYVPTGHIVFLRGGPAATLLAVPFDIARLEVKGSPVPVLEGIFRQDGSFAFSLQGDLVYVPWGLVSEQRLVRVSRGGRAEPLTEPGVYSTPALSPDGKKIAFRPAGGDLWVFDLERSVMTRLTFGFATVPGLSWTPDGARIVFASNQDGVVSPYWIAADGGGEARRLLETSLFTSPHSWSPDGTSLAIQQLTQEQRL